MSNEQPSAPRHRTILSLLAFLVLGLLPGLTRVETDNSPEVFFVEGSEGLGLYESFLATFGDDESLRLVADGPGLWTEKGLRWLATVEAGAAEVQGVSRAAGLPEHYRREGWPPKDPEDLRQRAMGNLLDRSLGWIGKEGQVTTVLVQFDAARGRQRILGELQELTSSPPEGVMCHWTGLPVLNLALDHSSQEIEQRFLPLLVLFAVVLLWLLLRDVKHLLVAMAFVGLCELLAMAPMGYASVKLNLVLGILPPLLFVISLATALHIVLFFRQQPSALEVGSRLQQTMQEKGWSVFWTGVTTMIGFASLATSDVGPIRSLGIWAAIGLATTTAAAFLFLPSMLAAAGQRGQGGRFEATFGNLGERWARWACKHHLGVLVGAGALVLLSFAGLPFINTESNALRYLASDHPARADIEALEARGIGVSAVEMMIRSPGSAGGAPAPFVSGIEVDRLADLGTELEKIPDVLGVVSAGTMLRDAARSVPTTPVNAAVRQQLVLEAMSDDVQGRKALATLLSEDRHTARVTVFVKTTGAEAIAQLLLALETAAQRRFPEASVKTTGVYPLLLEAQDHLISTLVLSLCLSLLVIGIILRLLLPSFRLAGLALAANIWPVVGALGWMGWSGMPLDIATVMVSAVILGLAVDDSIHTLGHFRSLLAEQGNRDEATAESSVADDTLSADAVTDAVCQSLRITAPAYVLTGLILAAGFGVCALSEFAPIARFGSLSAFAIVLAVLGDLLLLPALLSCTPSAVASRLAGSSPKRKSDRSLD